MMAKVASDWSNREFLPKYPKSQTRETPKSNTLQTKRSIQKRHQHARVLPNNSANPKRWTPRRQSLHLQSRIHRTRILLGNDIRPTAQLTSTTYLLIGRNRHRIERRQNAQTLVQTFDRYHRRDRRVYASRTWILGY